MIHPASFRDPNGFVFQYDKLFYRQINHTGRTGYDLAQTCGLHSKLQGMGMLIDHREVSPGMSPDPSNVYKVILPQQLPFVSYPYEWSFAQLKDAALLTLDIQLRAMDHGMSLKDASAFNVQFLDGQPILIDTLSFEQFKPSPWIAYRQYCEHFLVPLALAALIDPSLIRMLQVHLDGIPVGVGSRLLKHKLWGSLSLSMHIHWHARSQATVKPYARAVSEKKRELSSKTMRNLILDLRHTTEKLEKKRSNTVWGNYYQDNNYSLQAMECKSRIIEEYLSLVRPNHVWDLGANDGTFSRIAAKHANLVVSWDLDHQAVDSNYLQNRGSRTNILPLVLDLTNPSPALGWSNLERASMLKRGPVDLALGLALVHHLSITNHLSFEQIAAFFAQIAKHLIIEFVPDTDSQASMMLSTRACVSHEYSLESFKTAFLRHFTLTREDPIPDSVRTLYLFRRHE